MKRRFLILILPMLMGVLLPGCLQFKSQTAIYHYDKSTDTLRIFQDYHGIFGGDASERNKPGEPLTSQEKDQLDSVLDGQRTFFFSNWIFEFNRAENEELAAELKTPESRDRKNLPPEGLAKLEKLVALTLANIRVDNGPFYMDAKKQLAGVQYVTISNCKKVIAAINDYGPFFVQRSAQGEGQPDDDTAAMLKFAKNPQPLMQLDGNRLTIRWPMSRKSYDKTFGDHPEDPKTAAEMKRAGLKISFANDMVVISAGKPDDTITSLTLQASDTRYSGNLVAPAREKHVIKDSFDTAAAAKAFLEKGERPEPVTGRKP